MIVPGKTEKDLAKFSQAISDVAQGGTNALGGPIALTVGANETDVEDSRCTEGALPRLEPCSASAATAPVWLKATRRGGFTIGHDASTATDRVFRYEIRRP